MKQQHISKKLDRFLEQELRSDIKDLMIVQHDQSTYLFGKYTIAKSVNGYFSVRGNNTNADFEDLKTAVAYTVLHHERKHKEAERIAQLDISLSSIKFELKVHRNMLRNKSYRDDKLIHEIKIQEDNIRKKFILSEIQGYIVSSRYIQNRKFNQKQASKF
jgi:hypothetical protein